MSPNVRPERLMLDSFAIDPGSNSVHFRTGGKGWRWDLKSHELTEQPAVKEEPLSSLPLNDAPKASRRWHAGGLPGHTFRSGNRRTRQVSRRH